MQESIIFAVEAYLIAFVSAFFIAVSIKAMQAIIRRISPKKAVVETDEGK